MQLVALGYFIRFGFLIARYNSWYSLTYVNLLELLVYLTVYCTTVNVLYHMFIL